VAEWLSSAGVRTSVLESWLRVMSKRISADVRAVAQGTFDFATLEPLMAVSDQEAGEDEA
jgi:hypothetical protein